MPPPPISSPRAETLATSGRRREPSWSSRSWSRVVGGDDNRLLSYRSRMMRWMSCFVPSSRQSKVEPLMIGSVVQLDSGVSWVLGNRSTRAASTTTRSGSSSAEVGRGPRPASVKTGSLRARRPAAGPHPSSLHAPGGEWAGGDPHHCRSRPSIENLHFRIGEVRHRERSSSQSLMFIFYT